MTAHLLAGSTGLPIATACTVRIEGDQLAFVSDDVSLCKIQNQMPVEALAFPSAETHWYWPRCLTGDLSRCQVRLHLFAWTAKEASRVMIMKLSIWGLMANRRESRQRHVGARF